MCLTPRLIHETDHQSFSLLAKLDLDFLSCTYDKTFDTCQNTSKDEELNIVHYNVRGLSNKQRELGDLLSNCSGKEIHIATINETWLKPSNDKQIKVQGYNFLGKPLLNRKGGGVRFLINKKLRCRILPISQNFASFECCALELKLVYESVIIVTLYRPPNTAISDFLDEYEQLLLWLKSLRKTLIIGCDYNMDLLKSMTHCSTEAFVDLNLDNDLIPCIMKPTPITKETATLIDNVFVSSCLSERITSSIVVNDMSDHLPCKVTINNMFPLKNKTVTQEIRKVTKKMVKCMIGELKSTDWTFLYEREDMTSCNEVFNKFAGILNDCIDRNIPVQKITRTRLKPSCPWLHPNLCKCINTCKKLYAAAIQKGANATSWNIYVNYHNVLNCMNTWCHENLLQQ